MRSPRLPALAAVLLSVCPLARLSAWQCPDGTPPPCRSAAPARRPAPPLDDRTWIVLPFENVARAADIEWLRDASVNLLYLDLSRWRDIRVIDDERVADYMREVPETRGAGALGLQTGIAVARRAGAGKLVMGDLLKVGSRTRVVAKVFDVRTGQRIRSVQDETNNPDSLMSIFSRLARGILNVPPPEGAGATVGTTSLGAYQEYVAGVHSLSTWDLDSAQRHFEAALRLDTAFALAHYKLSVVFGWESASSPQRVEQAEAASRFATGLPVRERTLITGQLAQAHDRWGEACDAYQSLVRADSLDVEAWYNVGECSFHDPQVVAVGGDTSRLAFRGNWNTALRAFRKTLELDPTYHLAFAHIPDILQADQRAGCVSAAGQGACATTTHLSYMVRDADTLRLVPVSISNPSGLVAQSIEAARSETRRANFALARNLAAAWVAAGPTEARAHRALGRALLRTGDVAGADRELRQAGAAGTRIERVQYAQDQLEVAIKLDRFDAARALYDSLIQAIDSMQNVQAGLQVGVSAVTFGQFRRMDAAIRQVLPPAVAPFLSTLVRAIAGFPADSAERLTRAFGDMIEQAGQGHPPDAFAVMAVWSLPTVRTWTNVPALDTTTRDPRGKLIAFAMTSDTARTRRQLAVLDSTARSLTPEAGEGGLLIVSAQVHLQLGDSAGAYGQMLEYERRWPNVQMLERLSGGLAFGGFLWGRNFLLLGDLAAARGETDVARRAYARVLGLWERADPEVQPTVARVRAALARLGG